MSIQANAEHDPQHQQDDLGQPQTVTPSMERLMGKETAQPQQTQALPYGTPVAASVERILGKQALQKKVIQKNEGELTDLDKNLLYAQIGVEIGFTNSNFIRAANQVLGEIKSKKAADAALIASMINIAMVWIPGGLAGALGGIANSLGKSTNNRAFAAAYHLLDNKDKLASTLLTLPKDQIMRHVTVTGTAASNEAAFIDGMIAGFQSSLSELYKAIGTAIKNKAISDSELIAYRARWDSNMNPKEALVPEIRNHVKRWQDTVAPIGEYDTVKGSTIEPSRVTMIRKTGVVWVMQKDNTRALCLVQGNNKGQDASFRFLRFVSADMKEMALAKSIDYPMHHSGTPTLAPSDINYYPTSPLPKNVAKD